MKTQRSTWQVVVLLVLTPSVALRASECRHVESGRLAGAFGALAVSETAVFAARAHAWWLGNPSAPFHVVWGQSANSGQNILIHAGLAYQAAQAAALVFDWSCVPAGTSAWLAPLTGFVVQLPKQIGDGFHQEGFSVAEALWTMSAAALPGVHRAWRPSRSVNLKMWYWPSQEFLHRVGPFPTLESDYAGQRYFVTFDPGLLAGGAHGWPAWLGLAVGHSVDHWISAPPNHVWYATLDLNLRGLPIRAPWWAKVAAVLDQVHVPLPGLRLGGGSVTGGVF